MDGLAREINRVEEITLVMLVLIGQPSVGQRGLEISSLPSKKESFSESTRSPVNAHLGDDSQTILFELRKSGVVIAYLFRRKSEA